MKSGFEYRLSLSLRDENGEESCSSENYIRASLFEEWDAPWIKPSEDLGDAVIYFGREFELDNTDIENAVLYICGIGYHKATLNGSSLSDHRLAPSISNYNKRCYYETLDVSALLKVGKNHLDVSVAQGWRRNLGDYLKHTKDKTASFFGAPQLTAILSVSFEDGRHLKIVTDEKWSAKKGNITSSHLFDGESYDARISDEPADACVITDKPSKDTVMCPDLLEPITVKKIFTPVSIYKVTDGYIFDLGQNIAGVSEITVPADLSEGTRIVLQHAEMLGDDGDIYTLPLRGAKATDTYIVGKENPSTWSPSFTYHGFRYVKVCGLPCRPPKNFLRGLQFYTDIDSGSSFRCGSALVNNLQNMIVMTERDNIHSIATDCPQRDERMGWLNDASVRFEEMPYNFDVGRLFPKIIGDIRDEQIDGAITCTAPYIFGNRPADPVSSSFLIAAYMSYMHYGNTEIIRDTYPSMCAWNEYLEKISENGIIPLTYYGDWASPEDCCIGYAESALTPGEFMSTGYHYLNSRLLATFAEILGKSGDAERHIKRADFVRKAMLSKWLSADGRIATGSQACQAFALRLGILPEDMRAKAADIMNEEVIRAGMRLTTGNLCTLYLMEMLAEYGYIDTAWELITREEYPSWGYMMQNGATTVWERFELKKDPGMNSHCHPMYGSVGKWLYTHIAGITPLCAGFDKIQIRPYMPKKLLSAEATVNTIKGDVTVKWNKAYGKINLLVDIPNGSEANVIFGGKEYALSGGTHTYSIDEDDKT
jgi:alpha-L-rhamnosidase